MPNQFQSGRYCTICQQVWEFDSVLGREIKYLDMPSYGLEREYCPSCKESPKLYKDSPYKLARERHERLFTKVITDNPKLFKNNVEKQRTK